MTPYHERADATIAPAEARFGARALVAALALALVAVPFALLLWMVEGEWGPLLRLDHRVTDELHEVALDNSGYVRLMRFVSFLGSWPVYAVVFGGVWAWLLRRRLHRLAMFVLVTLPLSWLINGLTKELVDRARPVLPDPVLTLHTLSFPSGHAQSAVVAYSVLLLVFFPALSRRTRRAAVGASLAMVLLIGFSRVALGVHFVSDVLAGYVLGGAWVTATTALFSAWRREEGRPAVDLDEGLEPEHASELRGD
jgi:membrane-associated phospholipid phosphatase